MSLAELQRLALINAGLVQKGKPLQSYGLPSGQASEYAGLEGLFSSAQSAGSSSFFRDTIGGAVSGLTSLIKTGTEAGNYVGKQIGLPNLGSNLYTFLTPGSFLPDVLSRATTGKTLAEQLSSLGQNVAKDTSSTAYQVGNILGQAGTAILGTGAVSAGLKGLGIGAKAINAAGFTTTAADIGAGTAIGGALQAAGDWEQFDKSNGQPGAKMSGAEFLTRMGMGMITGGLSAPLNPRWGKLANIGFDALVGGATQGALEGAGYLAANKARQEEIEKTYKSNIATSAAINAAIGAGARGVQALLAPKPAAAETVAPAAPATPATSVAPVVAPPAAAQIHPYDQVEKNLGQWAQQLSPEQLVDHAQRWGVDNPTPQDLTAKIMSDVRNTDASGQNVEGTLEWVDQMIGENWHPKGTGQVLPVQPVAGAEQPQVSAEEAAERAAIAEAGQQAPEQSAPANIQPSPGGYVYDLPGTAQQVAQSMTLLERSNFADRVGLRSVATEAITQALNDPFVLTEHLLGKSPDLAKSLAQAMKLQDASPAAIVNAMRGGIDTSGKTPQEIYQRLGTMVERLVSTPPTPEPVPSPIQGEPNVQPRPEDVNVSEPGQPEPIAGEPPVQAVEPGEVQQAEAIPPTGAEGQAPEEVTTPITEPIAGEPNATQEGQVTEGGQPEYLGVPQGEDVQTNIPEVRQEEGGRPGDSGGLVESGQEQGVVGPVSQEDLGELIDNNVLFPVVKGGVLSKIDQYSANESHRTLGVKYDKNPLKKYVEANRRLLLPAVSDMLKDAISKYELTKGAVNYLRGEGIFRGSGSPFYEAARSAMPGAYPESQDLVAYLHTPTDIDPKQLNKRMLKALGGDKGVYRLNQALRDVRDQVLVELKSDKYKAVDIPDAVYTDKAGINAIYANFGKKPLGSSEGDAAVMDIASEGLLNQLGDEADTIDPESLVGQYVQDGKITDFPNATNDQIATAEKIIQSNLDGRKIQDAAAAIIDQEGVLSSESPQMAETMQKFLRGDGSGSHAIQMSVAGKENPLRRLIDILTEYTGVDVPDTRTMRREAEASEDRMSTYVFEKDGIPIATMAYYKEPGRKRAVMMLDPSPEFLAAVDLHRSEMLSQAMGEAYGEISPEIGEMFASTEAGVTPTQASELDVQNVQTMTKKRQMPYRESLEAQSKMRELYDETVQLSSETYGLESDQFYNAVDALSTAEQEVGATGDLFSSDAWQSYVDQLELESDKEVADDRAFRQDVREALAFKKQIEIAQSAVKEAPAPKRRRRLQRGQEGFDFSEGAAKASLGILPAVAAPTLEDDKEYFPGVNGATIKGLLLTVGAGAFMMHHISKKPVMHVGGDITGMTNERTTWLQSLRNRITGADSKRLMVAQITNDARKYGSIFGLSEDSINELIAKNLKDHTELEKIPSIPGLRGITALDILGRQVDSDLPGRLSDAAYAGRAVGEKRSIPINLAQKAFKSLPDDRQVALAKLMIDIDYATTARLNAEQAMVTSNLWTKQSKSLQDACAQEVQSILQKAQQANPDGWAQLSADYKMLEPIYDDARRAYFEMVAYEQTGVESIDAGFAQYNKKIDKLNVLLRNAVSDATKAREKKLSLEEIKAKNAAIEGINNQLAMAHKMRNVLGDLRNAREMSVARKYIPRWFDVEHHQHRIRIKETATDVGLMRSFANEADMANELERLNRPLTDQDRANNKIPEEHPVTGAKLNTWADYYRSQGGSVEVVRNRFNQTSLIQHTANQMALREALDALHDSVADGGSITADRFKQFLDTYGGDISNMVTGKELDDIGVSARKIDELVGTNSRVSTAQIRRLVNAIAVPQMVDNTMHRSNVLGYAPEPVIPGTNAVNKDYNKQMMDFIDNGFNFFLSRTKSKAESASLRREINTQIIDLTSRGIAPKYVSMLGDISSGLRWKPSVLTKSTGGALALTKADTTIAAFGAFKMMGGNVPSAVKNVLMGFVNTATQLPAETDGNLFKAVSLGVRGEAAYWRMLAKDRVMRKEMASYLRTPDTLQTVDEQIAKALSENDALRAVWTLAREADSFAATFYKSLERVLNPESITGSQSFKNLVEFGATPQVLAEHHNRGAAFMTGALAHLEQFPTDINGAFAQGLKFQGMTQGNFNNYNKSVTERKLLELPGSRSFLLLSNAALRSNEQLGAHFVAAAMRPTHAAVWSPLLAFAGTSMLFTGLIGAPIAGDVYKTINFFADLFEKDDGELNAIKESPLETLERKAGDVAESMGFGRDLGEYVFKNMAIGTSSVITGKNFSTENSVMNMVSQFPPPGLSIIPAAFDYTTKFADMSDKERLLRGSTLLNVEAGRAVRAIAQGIEGGKYDKSGNVVSPMYTWQQGVGNVLFGSDLDEAMYGTSKRGGGGKIYYADQANKYMNTISSISGLKLDDIHLRPFYQKTPGLPDEQANVEATNKFRALNIANYNSLKDQERQTLDIWNGITSDPEKRKILIRIAMEGQTGSRLSNETEEFLSGAERKIKSYYLALAVQQSYVQAGIPPPEFKYQAADPMVPVWKYIASKVKRGQLQLAPGD